MTVNQPILLGHCSKPECKATFKNHHWGKKAAVGAGWFFQRNGSNWCPDHNPEWLAEWRAKRNGS